jgi:hypothetical protein
MRKMMATIPDSDKEETRRKIEQNAGSLYHRTVLAIIVDAEDQAKELEKQLQITKRQLRRETRNARNRISARRRSHNERRLKAR